MTDAGVGGAAFVVNRNGFLSLSSGSCRLASSASRSISAIGCFDGGCGLLAARGACATAGGGRRTATHRPSSDGDQRIAATASAISR
jgi:hypothetical protein